MKNTLLSLLALTITILSFGQAPEAFKYQAVVRDAGGVILTNQAVGYQLTILQGSATGTAVYTETFAPSSNSYGLVNIEIGTGNTVDDFSTIDWANGPYYIETAVDVNGGTSYAVMGTSQLISVPYALHANSAENVTNDQVDDADADPTNEIQDITLNGTDLSIDSGSTVDLSTIQDGTTDADDDPTNELQDWSTLPGIPADLNDGIDDVDDADADPTNEIQDINLTGTDLSIDNGSTVDLSTIQDGTTDADADPTNELQDWSTLPGIPADLNDGVDDVDDADADPTNEIQVLSLSNDTLYLSNGNNVDLGNLNGFSSIPEVRAGQNSLTDQFVPHDVNVTFSSPMPNSNYSVAVTANKKYLNGGGALWITNKTASGFKINVENINGSSVLPVVFYWTVTEYQ
jgi:hypothetical protein